jgi:hypothetical protein
VKINKNTDNSLFYTSAKKPALEQGQAFFIDISLERVCGLSPLTASTGYYYYYLML